MGSGFGFVGPEHGAVAVQEHGGDFAGVEEARRVGVLEREGEFRRHGEVDAPDQGEERWGSQVSRVDTEVGFHAFAEAFEAGGDEDLGRGVSCEVWRLGGRCWYLRPLHSCLLLPI